MKLQRKMFEANKALTYFTTHNFDFKNENFKKLSTYLRPEDLKAFENTAHYRCSLISYSRFALYGFRRYLLNFKDDTLEKDRHRANKIRITTAIFKYLLYFFLFCYIIFRTDILSFLPQRKLDYSADYLSNVLLEPKGNESSHLVGFTN